MLIVPIALLSAAAAIGAVLLRPSLVFLNRHGIVRVNYSGEPVPTAGGLYLWGLLVAYGLTARAIAKLMEGSLGDFFGWPGADDLGDYMFAMTAVAVFGLLDDTLGDRSVKGFGGHCRQLMRHGVLTTGMLKAGGIGAASMWLASGAELDWPGYAAHLLLPPLCANACNLLDVRPGRALKLFLPSALLMLIAAAPEVGALYIVPLAVGAALLFPLDAGGKMMLGDTGANLLGFAAGYWFAVSAGSVFQWVIIALLGAFHWFADRRSLTEVIAGNRVLNWWDKLGRNGY